MGKTTNKTSKSKVSDMSVLGTITGTGFPYALEACLLPKIKAKTYIIGSDGYIEDFKKILDEHEALIIGDLPRTPAAEHINMLKDWLTNGRRLLYFIGWRDHGFVQENKDIFGVDLDNPLKVNDSSLQKIVWKDNNMEINTVPNGIRYLVKASSVSGTTVMETLFSNQPVLVRNVVGKGSVVFVLCPISLPLSKEWLVWPDFPLLIEKLLKLPKDSSAKDNSNSVLKTYGKIISSGLNNNEINISEIIDLLPKAKKHSIILTAEMCRLLRIIGKETGNHLLVALSWFLLKNIWSELSKTHVFDYAPFQKHWYSFLEHLDRLYYGNDSLKTIVVFANDSFKLYRLNMPTYFQSSIEYSYSDVLKGLSDLADAIEGHQKHSRIIQSLNFATESFMKTNDSLYSHVKFEAITVCLTVAIKLLPSLELVKCNIYDHKILEKVENFKSRSNETDFLYSVNVLINAFRYMSTGDESAAWANLTTVRDRIIKGIMITVLRLRQALNTDPLCFLEVFNDCDDDVRKKMTQCMLELSRLKIEGEPVCIRIIFAHNPVHLVDCKEQLQGKSLISTLKLTDNHSVYRKIASVSRLWPYIVCDTKGNIVAYKKEIGARNHKAKNQDKCPCWVGYPLDDLEGTFTTISSVNGTIRIYDKKGEGLEYSKGVWRIASCLSADKLYKMLAGVISNDSCQTLTKILGDLQAISDDGIRGFHGTILVAYEDEITASQVSDKIDHPFVIVSNCIS
ncbi:MAG: hypothetical protein H7843_11380 [Nitrospirota bacterium]